MKRIIRLSCVDMSSPRVFHLSGDVQASPGEVLHVQLADFSISVGAGTNLRNALGDQDLHILSNLNGVTLQNNSLTNMLEPSRLLSTLPRANSFIYGLSRAPPPTFPIAQRQLDRLEIYFEDTLGNRITVTGTYSLCLIVESVKP